MAKWGGIEVGCGLALAGIEKLTLAVGVNAAHDIHLVGAVGLQADAPVKWCGGCGYPAVCSGVVYACMVIVIVGIASEC